MKKFALSFLLMFSLVFAPVHAEDTLNFDLPPELMALLQEGEPDPVKIQALLDSLPAEQRDKILQEAAAMVSKMSPEEQEQMMREAQAILPKLTPELVDIKHAIVDQIGQISFLLQDLGQQVTVNKKLNIPNKAEVETQLGSLQQTLEEIKRNALTSTLFDNPESLFRMLLMVEELLRCIDGAVVNKLTSIPEINEANITSRSIPIDTQDFSIKLKAGIEQNKKRLITIHKLTNDMGATWFNRAYKQMSSKVNPHNVLLTGVAVGLITYYMYRFSNESFGAYPNGIEPKPELENWFQKLSRKVGLAWWKKNIPGERPIPCTDRIPLLDGISTDVLNNADQANFRFREVPGIANSENITKFGTTVAKLEELGIFNPVTSPLFTLGGMWMLFQDKAKDAATKVKNECFKLHAYLQGKDDYKVIDDYAREPRFTLSDVEGHEHIKRELEILPAYFADPEKMDRTGKSPGRFWMLHGNSRTGKSMLSEAIAGQIKAALAARGSSQKFTYMPITAEMLMMTGIGPVINYANSIKPCLICIDEFDLAGAQRERNKELLAELLNAMGNAQLSDDVGNQVFFMFICNHIEHNDFALINRMDHIIEVNLPTIEDRAMYLDKAFKKQFIFATPEFILKLAQESEGKTLEELGRTITLAKQTSFRNLQPVTEADLQEAFNQQVHRIVYARLPFDADQTKQIAAFQAGKALVMSYATTNIKIAQATILGVRKKIHEVSMWSNATLGTRKQRPKEWTKYGQVFTFHADDAIALETHEELINAIKLKLAGHIAQELICGTQSANYRKNAKNKAYALAGKVIFAGVDETFLPKEVKNNLKNQTHELVMRCEQEVRALLTEHKAQLEQLTENLTKNFIVYGDEIKQLVAGIAPQTSAQAPLDLPVVETPLEEQEAVA